MVVAASHSQIGLGPLRRFHKLSRHTSRTRVRGDTRVGPEADRRRYQATTVGVVLRGEKKNANSVT